MRSYVFHAPLQRMMLQTITSHVQGTRVHVIASHRLCHITVYLDMLLQCQQPHMANTTNMRSSQNRKRIGNGVSLKVIEGIVHGMYSYVANRDNMVALL